MSLQTAQNRLRQSMKEINHHWDHITSQWDDPVSRKFYEQRIAPLESMVRSSMAAMDKMAKQLAKARNDCGS